MKVSFFSSFLLGQRRGVMSQPLPSICCDYTNLQVALSGHSALSARKGFSTFRRLSLLQSSVIFVSMSNVLILYIVGRNTFRGVDR